MEIDPDEPLRLHQLAADGAQTDALRDFGWLCRHGVTLEKDNTKEYEFYLRAAPKGDNHARVKVGKCFKSGVGTEQDIEEPVYYYKQAAVEGHSKRTVQLELYL